MKNMFDPLEGVATRSADFSGPTTSRLNNPQQVVFKFLEFNKPARDVERETFRIPLPPSPLLLPSSSRFSFPLNFAHTSFQVVLGTPKHLKHRTSDLEKIRFRGFGKSKGENGVLSYFYYAEFLSPLVSSTGKNGIPLIYRLPYTIYDFTV